MPRPDRSGGDRGERLRGLVEENFDRVWRAVKRLGVPDGGADDAAQEVFIIAARRLDEIEVGRERGYLLGIALRVASDARRALRRRAEVPLEAAGERHFAEAGPAVEGAEARLDGIRARQALAVLLGRMPEEMREAFVLFELEELPAPEVASVLGIPVGTVASRVRRARDFIRQGLTAGEGRP